MTKDNSEPPRDAVRPPKAPVRPRYELEELLSECDFERPQSADDQAWLSGPPVGREII